MKKIISLVSCVAVVGSMGIAEAREALPLSSQEQCSGLAEANTLKMEVEAQRLVVTAGRTARFLVTVTRGADDRTDPRQPAAGAKVWIVLSPDLRPVWGGGETDKTGTALVSVRIPEQGLRGWLEGAGRATITYGEPPCRTAEEVGAWEAQRALKVEQSS